MRQDPAPAEPPQQAVRLLARIDLLILTLVLPRPTGGTQP